MKNFLWGLLAVIVGVIAGSIINMGIVMISMTMHPELQGIDMTDTQAFVDAMKNFTASDYILPWLAHALGTLVGAFVAAKIAKEGKMICALIIGVWFLIGGIMNMTQLPMPTWVAVLDLGLAYIPMAYIGGKLAVRK